MIFKILKIVLSLLKKASYHEKIFTQFQKEKKNMKRPCLAEENTFQET